MKELKVIINEIENLENDYINTQIDESGIYKEIKEEGFVGKNRYTTKDFWDRRAKEQKQRAINFITEKYNYIEKELQKKSCVVSEYDYEVAYYKTFEQYFNIVLDQKKVNEINEYIDNKMNKFFEGFTNIYNT